MPIVYAELEEWSGSPVIRELGRRKPERWPAKGYKDKAGASERQDIFHKNLLKLAPHFPEGKILVDFYLDGRGRVALDKGCTKMAELAGFIKPLQDGPSGVVDFIELNSTAT